MILSHISKISKKMSHDGEWYANLVMNREKVHTKSEAFISGFTDACDLISKYIVHYKLDK